MLRNGVKTVTELRPPSRIGRRREVYNVGSNPRHGCQAVLKGKDATNDEIGLQAGTITVKDVETEPPSPFAENIQIGRASCRERV